MSHIRPSSPYRDPVSQRANAAQEACFHGMVREPQGRDACGIGFVANIAGQRSHEIVASALQILVNLTHRAAVGADPETGDGAGITLQIPHRFFSEELARQGVKLRGAGTYAVGMLFLPRDPTQRQATMALVEQALTSTSLQVLAWREVPVNASACGSDARSVLPHIMQVFVAPIATMAPAAFERALYLARRRMEKQGKPLASAAQETFYVCSLSTKTVVYKGLLLPKQMTAFFCDLGDERLESAIALVHSRFSTNTFPSWERAHPYRYVMHNGEFNTVQGNVNWMRAREASLASPEFGVAVEDLRPVIDLDGSDSAMFDNAVELLLQSGRSLPHAMMMLVPEAWQQHREMSARKRAFYEFHACMMEPWDGPAALGFTDGSVVGALLDRNGLRPARYVVTKDGRVILSSEVGVLPVNPEQVVTKGRLEPGKMLLIDTQAGRIIDDAELKEAIAGRRPYEEWLYDGLVDLESLTSRVVDDEHVRLHGPGLLREQMLQGYSREDLVVTLRRMAVDGEEPIGSMGNDTPLAVLSTRPQSLFAYFRQTFAQVTNPPIDPLRESLVMSLTTTIGQEQNLFAETSDHCRVLRLAQPLLTHAAMAAIRRINRPGLRTTTLDALFNGHDGGVGLEQGLHELCRAAEQAVDQGYTLVVLSDRQHSATWAPIPALLAVGAVHHHLIRCGKRSRCGLIVESGEPREVMHMALLLGYGAGAIYPYLVWDTLAHEAEHGELGHCDAHAAEAHYIKAVSKGLLKTMSKMGISTLQSYRGAQVFEAIGLSRTVVERYLTWTTSKIEGVGLPELAQEVLARHVPAYEAPRELVNELEHAGMYQWRRGGEMHMYDPESIGLLQHAARSGDFRTFKKFSAKANASAERLYTPRGLLKLRKGQAAIDLAQVEPVSAIIQRFRTGAMSFGSISKEAHENLAVAMNRIGAKSNTGEGGEEPERFAVLASGESRRSAIKQVASARFGVTSNYLVNADELQIKMAQGAKPGEGGQLPGHKVDAAIARVRHATPGVGLISPPPHHDIYSIEDLAQLIFDLKNANERAAISVKLVSEAGVGTVAAGVAKAKADAILISGDCGGTGASPLTSIKHAGTPWEFGLAEAHQALLVNGLRQRVRLETDGHLKTGRDVAIACLLGAELFGFGTAALVASGCIMMRVCHLNTCPVGVATQDPELRKRFKGEPQHVINFMYFVAQELREIMAELGFRTVAEMVGRVDHLAVEPAIEHFKARGLDLSPLLHRVDLPPTTAAATLGQVMAQEHGLQDVLDRRLLSAAAPALQRGEKVRIESTITNGDRTVCTMLSSEVSRRYGESGLPAGTITVHFAGSAGQSFAAFMAAGLDVRLTGEANDYVAKGMSGGRLVIVPPAKSAFAAEENVIVGNVVLYGATQGELYVRGRAGERFAVRNSGATAVVEGVGDHGCEYMTGGTVVVLGRTGRNFGAGMSGGVAYVWDEVADFRRRCNQTMVHLEHLDARDDETLREVINRHADLTGSHLAARLLRDWSRAKAQFWKVISPEYKRVLVNREKTQRAREVVRLATL